VNEITIAMSPVAVSRTDAARALGVSLGFFETEIQHELRLVRRKSKVLVPVADLERWLGRELRASALRHNFPHRYGHIF
jgi:hypothetical protein